MSYPLVSIKDFCTTSSGGTPSRDNPEYYTGSIPWIKSGDLRENLVTEATEFLSEDAIQNSSAKIVKKGALLLAMYGATVGRMAILGIDAATNQAVCSIVPDESKAFPKYVYYALLNKVPEFLRNAVGGAQPNINQGIIKETKIPLPPLAEQKRIAAILDKADAIRRKRQQAIQLADDFLRSVFLDMFGDPVTNPKGWEVRNLDSCLDFLTSGSRGWAQYYSEQGDKFIRIQNVGKNKLLLADMAYINAPSGAEAIRTKIKKGDVLLSITADLGRASVVTEDISGGFINQHLAILRVNQNQINPRYLAAFLSSDAGVRQFTSKNKSAVKAGLNFSDIKSLAIALPPLNLQKKYEYIYEKLEQLHINNFKDAHQSNSLFNSLSQKAFSGQL